MDEQNIVRRAVRLVELYEEKGIKRDDVVINVSRLLYTRGQLQRKTSVLASMSRDDSEAKQRRLFP